MTLLTGQDPAAGGQGNAPANGTPPGNQPPTDWRASLPEDLRSEKVFDSIKGKDWSEAGPLLAKGYVNAQRMIGAEKLVIPGDKATPEEWSSFYNKLGRPETPDKYSYKLPDGVKPEQLDKATLDTWLKELHEAGVPAKAADRIVSKYLVDEQARAKALEKAEADKRQGWELQLKKDLGPKYDESLNYARWALKEFGDVHGNLVKMLDETGLGDNPAIVKFFAQVGARLADDKARGVGGGPRFSAGMGSPEEAQASLTAFNRDPEKQKAMFDPQHPNHAAVIKERTDLFLAAFPKET